MARFTGSVYTRFALILLAAAAAMLPNSKVSAESVLVIQGYQKQTEKYAAQTVDAYVKAFATTGRTVSAVRPQSQPGWEGGDAYTDAAGLLALVSQKVSGQAIVSVIVGDADKDGRLLVSEDSAVSASDLTDALSAASRISVVSAGCNALAMDIGKRLSNTDLVASGVGAGQLAHSWPRGNRDQYDLFSRYLLEGFYLEATHAGASGSTGEMLGRAFPLAQKRMVNTSGGYQSPEGGLQGMTKTVGPATTRLRSRDYSFVLVPTGRGSAAGFVSNGLGLPISALQGGSVVDGMYSFSFEERGRSRKIAVAEAEDGLRVTIDGRPVDADYVPDRADLVHDGQRVGVSYTTVSLSGIETAATLGVAGGSQPHAASSDGTISFTVTSEGQPIDVTLKPGPLGSTDVQVGGARYDALDVLRYGLYTEDGARSATVLGVLSNGAVAGSVLPDAGEMRLPLSGQLTAGNLSANAELVGTTYSLDGTNWSTNRPPTEGDIQPDFLDLPSVVDAYANATSGDGRATVSWDVDMGLVADPILLGDLSFQVLRTEQFSGKAEIFVVPAGRRQYVDRPSGDPSGFEYSVRPVLDHRVTTCETVNAYPLVGASVTAREGKPAPKPSVAPGAVVAQEAPERSSKAETPAPETDKREEEKKKEEMPWEKPKGETLGGKIIYGVFGAMIILAIAIALGAGGSSNGGIDPGDLDGGPIDQ